MSDRPARRQRVRASRKSVPQRRRPRFAGYARRLRLEPLEDRRLLATDPAHLIAYWSFDEGSGGVASDSIGGNHGMIQGASWSDAGVAGGALSFDGLDDYVDAGNAFVTPEAFSIEAWVKIGAYSENPIVGNADIDRVEGRTQNFIAAVNREYNGAAGRPFLGVGQRDWDWEHFWGDTILDLNQWHHLAFVWDFSQTPQAEVYVNGVLDQAYTNVDWFGDPLGPINRKAGVPLTIGKTHIPDYSGPYHFTGLMDEVAIYDGRLNSEQIEQDYQNGLIGLPAGGLISHILTVNSTADLPDQTPLGDGLVDVDLSTPGPQVTLRAAIQEANALPGQDTIRFAISGAGPHTIRPASALPTITDPVVIDGYTQPGASTNTNPTGQGLNTVLMIELDGSLSGSHGLVITAGHSTVRGLAVNSFAGIGILLLSNGNNRIQGNFVGTDPSGTIAKGNGSHGVQMSLAASYNVIGTDGDGVADAAEANLISGNLHIGVVMAEVNTDHNKVAGNLIGTDFTGARPLANHRGVLVGSGSKFNVIGTDGDGAADAQQGNVISGNAFYGVLLEGVGTERNVIAGNFIGTDVTGSVALANRNNGVSIYAGARNNRIGTNGDGANDAAEGNLISGNGGHGVSIQGSGTDQNVVAGNFIGTDASGTRALANKIYGVAVVGGAKANIIGTNGDGVDNDGERNIISGNTWQGIWIAGSGTTHNTVAGNFIGTDVTGSIRLGNGGKGVWIKDGAESNVIGTNGDGLGDAAERNLISGNAQDGVAIDGVNTENNVVAGNFIGTDLTGTLNLGNGTDGVVVAWGSHDNRIGTNGDGIADAAERNVVSANNRGIVIIHSGTAGNIIAGNFVGLAADGFTALGNTNWGVGIGLGAQSNRIGTNADGVADDAERNVISGNGGYALTIWEPGTKQNVVAGNFIGTDATGQLAVGNTGWAVMIAYGAQENRIGTDGKSTVPEAERNVISANANSGVLISGVGTERNVVAGNFIGPDVTGTRALGNKQNGVAVAGGAKANIIGTNDDGLADDVERNVISGNRLAGVVLQDAGTDFNVVAGNYIGSDLTGGSALGNGSDGVRIQNGANFNQIGGLPGPGNFIAFNGGSGVVVGPRPKSVPSDIPLTAPDDAGQALEFDGVDNFVEIADSSTLHSDRQLTVSGWFRVNSFATTWQTIFWKGNTPDCSVGCENREYGLWVNSSGFLHFSSTPQSRIGVGERVINTAPFVQLGRWYYFAAQVDANSSAMRIYVDGELRATGWYDPSGIRDTTGPLRFGKIPTAYPLYGSLDEISIWNVARTQDEIRASMYSKLRGDETGLLAYWDFDEGTGSTVFDKTGHGNDGGFGVASTSNRIQANAIFSNGSLGIDLGNDGPTLNDAGDGDAGANQLQNFPVLVLAEQGSTRRVVGTLNSTPNASFTVDFFANNAADPSGFGEGQRYLGSTTVSTDASGNASFDVTHAGMSSAGEFITATATSPDGSTSEFSAPIVTATPGVFVVTNTLDDGTGSLRWAIQQANATLVTDRIQFDIPGAGPHRIQPASALPTIVHPAILDGATQPGYAGSPIIELDGNAAGAADGLTVMAGKSTVRGLVINRFAGSGIVLQVGGGNVVEGNFVGTDVNGIADFGNLGDGVLIFQGSSENRIGTDGDGTADQAERNVISGNGTHGVLMAGAGTRDNVVAGNLIGTDATAGVGLGNAGSGVFFAAGAQSNRVGGSQGLANVIAFNAGAGVAMAAETTMGNEVRLNVIHSNGGVGIDLGDDGPTANHPGDTDAGPNGLQNYPVISKAAAGAATHIVGSMNSAANTTYTLDFYCNDEADPSGYGEGQHWIASSEVTTDSGGSSALDIWLPVSAVLGQIITATATAPNGSTSEFSASVTTGFDNVFIVTNTFDSGAGSLRWAIEQANLYAGLDAIHFNIPGAGPHSIQPRSGLPTIAFPVVIDGYTQPGASPNTNPTSGGLNTVLMVEVDGSVAGGADGLTLVADRSTVRGLAVNRFGGHGIVVRGGSKNVIEGNFVGTDVSGNIGRGNAWDGVLIYAGGQSNRVGTDGDGRNDVAERNLISGNGWIGVACSDLGTGHNVVAGNLIGTDATGTKALANARNGVLIVAGAQANRIGTNGDGVGDEAERNFISGNAECGVDIVGPGTDNNTVASNFIGTDVTGMLALGNGQHGVRMMQGAQGNIVGTDGSGQFDAAEGNVISGNGWSGVALWYAGTERNVIAGNLVGTDATGAVAVANKLFGIEINDQAKDNRVGTNGDGVADVAERNLISGNTLSGVAIRYSGADNNRVAGNFIGTDLTGTTTLPNGGSGVNLSASTTTFVLEAEAFSSRMAYGGRAWVVCPTESPGEPPHLNQRGSGYIQVLPDPAMVHTDPLSDTAPYVDYRLTVTTPGDYRLYARWDGHDYQSDSFYARILELHDGLGGSIPDWYRWSGESRPSDADFATDPWVGVAAFESTSSAGGEVASVWKIPAAGNYTLRVTAREDGTAIDTLILQLATAAAPVGDGPSGSGPQYNIIGTNGDGVADEAERNIVSGNTQNGVWISGTGTDSNTVAGNFIGTDITGINAVGNGYNGVGVNGGAKQTRIGTNADGAADDAERNIVSGNLHEGIRIADAGTDYTVVAGNFIGTDVTGMLPLGNGLPNHPPGMIGKGLIVIGGARWTRIGTNGDGIADSAERNVISANRGTGLEIRASGSDYNIVAGNYIGTDATGFGALPNDWQGVLIQDGARWNVVGTNGDGIGDEAERNVVSGNGTVGVQLQSADSNVLAGNFIGTNATGAVGLGNKGPGVSIFNGARSNVIGTNGDGVADDAEGNVISGNAGHGVAIWGNKTDQNVLAGNYIGTDVSGTLALGNKQYGVAVSGGAKANIIGTNGDGVADDAERNVISGNAGHGVAIWGNGTDQNVVAGNYIGTDVSGSFPLGNGFGIAWGTGVQIWAGAKSNRIGTNGDGIADAAERNVISANATNGVAICDPWTNYNVVAGNYVGTDASGSKGLGNGGGGVVIWSAAASNRIGTDGNGVGAAAEGNVISANTAGGVFIGGNGANLNLVAGNFIGTDATGRAALGNGGNGVGLYDDSPSNQIGGPASLSNTIAFNSGSGVAVLRSNSLDAPAWVLSGVPLSSPAQPGTALHLDGVGDWVEIADSPSLHSDRQLTVSGWFKADAFDKTWQNVFWKGDLPDWMNSYANREAGLWINSSGFLILQSTPANRVSVGPLGLSTPNFIQLGRWYHFAAVINADGNYMQIYVDGNLMAQGPYDVSGIRDTSGPLRFGSNPSMGEFLHGSIDEMSIWKVARTQAEIRADMYGKLNGHEAGLVGYWSCDEGAGDVLYDQTSNGNHGILGGPMTGNKIQINSIYSNGSLGIDLGGDGPTLNDPNDEDIGPNGLQNFPVMLLAESGPTTHVVGMLNSTPDEIFTLDFYTNDAADPSGFGEGQTYLGSAVVTTDGNGSAGFDVVLPTASRFGQRLTATATDSDGNTSEFSAPVFENARPVAEAGGAYLVPVNGRVRLDASGSSDADQHNTTLTYEWDLDGDGRYGETGADAARGIETGMAPLFWAGGLPVPSSWTVSLRITDDAHASSADTATIHVVYAPDLAVDSSSIRFSTLHPQPGESFTISATITNQGLIGAANFLVRFLDFDTPIGEATVSNLDVGETVEVSVPAAFSEANYRLITVKVDPEDVVLELNEDNNQAGLVLQVGDPSASNASLVLQTTPVTAYRGRGASVAGRADYDFDTVPGTYDFPVRGARVTVTVTDPATARVLGVYAGSYTDANGDFSQPILAPNALGTYDLLIEVTDRTSAARVHSSLIVLDHPDLPPLPPPTPEPGRSIQDVLVFSDDIVFDNDNPELGEVSTIFAFLQYTGPEPADDVPVTISDIFPVGGVLQRFEIAHALVDFPASPWSNTFVTVSVPWRNTAEGAHVIQVAAEPAFPQNTGNDRATRLIQVGPEFDFLRIEKTVCLLLDADHDLYPTPGDTLEYTINFRNTGTSDLTGAVLTDDYDELLLQTPSLVSPDGVVSGGIITWAIGLLAADGSGSVTYQIDVRPVDEFPGQTTTVVNTAVLDTDQTPPVAVMAQMDVRGDSLAPTTTAALTPGPNGHGWNNTSVDVVLTAVDNPGGSGVREIVYWIDGSPATTVPADTIGFTFTAEGVHTLNFFGIDAALNAEPLHTLEIRIDKTPPEPIPGGPYVVNEGSTILLDGTRSTDALSGIASTAWAIDGDGLFNDSDPAAFAGLDGPSSHEVFLQVTDKGGNVVVVQTEVSVRNVPPSAIPDEYRVDEDGTLFVSAEVGVLSNDTDPGLDRDAFKAEVCDGCGPIHGSLLFHPDGSFTYTPDGDYNGLDGFAYLVHDGEDYSEYAAVSIFVRSVIDAVMDIKPGGFPNSINLGSKGVLPIALLSTQRAKGELEDFDATAIDPATILFGDSREGFGRVRAIRATFEDVDHDGDLDLILHFDMEAIVAQHALDADSVDAVLSADFDGDGLIDLLGHDSVRIVPSNKTKGDNKK